MADEKASTYINDEDSGITMLDVLEEERELEDDANAVLGGSDDQNCTYNKGYVRRQALYACGTCITSDKEPGGICLACSYACHEGHDLFELYTKRNFRCDCGNSKFASNPCRLCPEKVATNLQNQYNQNFYGKYCICSRPYPDADDDEPDEMVQCIACEDWYHGRHLGVHCLENKDFGEMICSGCMEKMSFLWAYNVSTECTVIKTEDKDSVVNVEQSSEEATYPIKSESQSNQNEQPPKPEANNSQSDMKAKTEEQECDTAEKTSDCKWKSFPCNVRKGPAFWSVGWRLKLCRCPECTELYAKHNCTYILDNDDTVHAYEEEGKAHAAGQSQYDKGMLALNSLGRVQQMEAIHEYNSMKSELKEYLKKFADSKKVVREEDIHEFFSNMQAKKKQKTDCNVPHFCR